jgi:hypothetical protein
VSETKVGARSSGGHTWCLASRPQCRSELAPGRYHDGTGVTLARMLWDLEEAERGATLARRGLRSLSWCIQEVTTGRCKLVMFGQS